MVAETETQAPMMVSAEMREMLVKTLEDFAVVAGRASLLEQACRALLAAPGVRAALAGRPELETLDAALEASDARH